MAQSVEHVIGNDEVISSILITSSKKRTSQEVRFCLYRDENFATMAVLYVSKTSHKTSRQINFFAKKELTIHHFYVILF